MPTTQGYLKFLLVMIKIVLVLFCIIIYCECKGQDTVKASLYFKDNTIINGYIVTKMPLKHCFIYKDAVIETIRPRKKFMFLNSDKQLINRDIVKFAFITYP